ncbi:hypothetical protein [Helicobacter sp. T3_23-1056]
MSLRASARRERGNPNTTICHTEISQKPKYLKNSKYKEIFRFAQYDNE